MDRLLFLLPIERQSSRRPCRLIYQEPYGSPQLLSCPGLIPSPIFVTPKSGTIVSSTRTETLSNWSCSVPSSWADERDLVVQSFVEEWSSETGLSARRLNVSSSYALVPGVTTSSRAAFIEWGANSGLLTGSRYSTRQNFGGRRRVGAIRYRPRYHPHHVRIFWTPLSEYLPKSIYYENEIREEALRCN